MNPAISINRCPSHDFWMISIDNGHTGTRVVGGKCCGRWETIHQWPLTQELADEIVNEMQCAIDYPEDEP